MPLSDVHGCQRQNLGPLLLPQLGGHNAADSRPNGLAGLVDEHAGVVIELDHATVRSLPLLRCAHNNGVSDVSSSYLVRCADGHAVARLGAEVALLLDDNDDSVACGGLTSDMLGRDCRCFAYQLWRGASIAGH